MTGSHAVFVLVLAFDLEGSVAFVLTDVADVFAFAADAESQRAGGRFFSDDQVAGLKVHQVRHLDGGFSQQCRDGELGHIQLLGESADDACVLTVSFVLSPGLVGEFFHHRFDDVVGDAQTGGPGTATHLDFKAHHHDHFIGWNNLDQLRVGFNVLVGHGEFGD